MRIHPKDLAALRAAIAARFSAADIVEIQKRYAARDLSAMRFRWDMMHASGFNTAPLYRAGLNDSHIDTALRNIFENK